MGCVVSFICPNNYVCVYAHRLFPHLKLVCIETNVLLNQFNRFLLTAKV